jgi:threonine dehydrogenase-like Zn-dependent dehydrogenase
LLAARYYGIGQVRVEDIPAPVCGPGQALIRVAYAGVCGSDLHIFRKGMFVTSIPETMGHEFSGVVEQSVMV